MMGEIRAEPRKQTWFCSGESDEEVVSACTRYIHTTLMPNRPTLDQNVRSFINHTLTECQYHNVHLVIALIYLKRYRENMSPKDMPENTSRAQMWNDWDRLKQDIHVALHLAECWHPFDKDAPLKGSHVVKQSGLLGQIGEKRLWDIEWDICKALDWRLMVTSEEFISFIEAIIQDKKKQEVTRLAIRGGTMRGGQRRACTTPATLNRGEMHAKSEPAVQGPREMLSPKGGHGDNDFRFPDKASDEDTDSVKNSERPSVAHSMLGRSNPDIAHHNPPQHSAAPRPGQHCQAPRPVQTQGGGIASRRTVGGAPLATDKNRFNEASHLMGNGNVGARANPFSNIRGREPANRPESRTEPGGHRIPLQATPFSTGGGGPPPVSGRGAGQRLETTTGVNSRYGAGAGGIPASALDRQGGAEIRISSAPGTSGTSSGAQNLQRTPTNTHTPRPAFSASTPMGSAGARAGGGMGPRAGAGAGPPQSSAYPYMGGSPHRVNVARGYGH